MADRDPTTAQGDDDLPLTAEELLLEQQEAREEAQKSVVQYLGHSYRLTLASDHHLEAVSCLIVTQLAAIKRPDGLPLEGEALRVQELAVQIRQQCWPIAPVVAAEDGRLLITLARIAMHLEPTYALGVAESILRFGEAVAEAQGEEKKAAYWRGILESFVLVVQFYDETHKPTTPPPAALEPNPATDNPALPPPASVDGQ